MGHVMDLLMLAVLLFLLMVAFGLLSIWGALRMVRRRSWRLTTCLLRRGGREIAGATVGGAQWMMIQPWGRLHWWRTELLRRRMWLAVNSACGAVSNASKAGSPIGELPALCDDLNGVACQADTALRISATATAGSRASDTNRLVDDVLAAAARIHDSATSSATHDLAANVGMLVSQCTQEAEALTAGQLRLS